MMDAENGVQHHNDVCGLSGPTRLPILYTKTVNALITTPVTKTPVTNSLAVRAFIGSPDTSTYARANWVRMQTDRKIHQN